MARAIARRDANWHDAIYTPPRDAKGKLSLFPEDWEALSLGHPLLRAWGDVKRTVRVLYWVQRSGGSGVIRDRYQTLPRLSIATFDLEFLRRLAKPLGGFFVPHEGEQLLLCKFDNLELRSWAAHCVRCYHRPDVLIENLYDRGVDPTRYTAARLFARDSNSELTGPLLERGFDGLAEEKPQEHENWLHIADVLLMTLPRALGIRQITELLRARLGNDTIGESRASQLSATLISAVHQEFKEFLVEDPTLRVLASTLGTKDERVFSQLLLQQTPGTTEAHLRNVLLGKNHSSEVWSALRSLTIRPAVRECLDAGPPGSYELLLQRTKWWSGRYGRWLYCTHARGTEHLGLAADVMKSAAYSAVAAGLQLCAIAEDEFVARWPRAAHEQPADVEARIEQAVARFLAKATRGCCRCEVSGRW